jgi:hypothetical protein
MSDPDQAKRDLKSSKHPEKFTEADEQMAIGKFAGSQHNRCR